MRVAGIVIAVAGLCGAIAGPVLGFPGAFAVLLVVAVVLWLVGIGVAAASLAPPRPVTGIAALVAALCGWPMIPAYSLAPAWGAVAAASGALVATESLQRRLWRR
jgi:hypothetical protein